MELTELPAKYNLAQLSTFSVFLLLTFLGGRPNFTPFSFAIRRPSLQRSTMISLSNWAHAPIILAISSPAGPKVLILSFNETKAISFFFNYIFDLDINKNASIFPTVLKLQGSKKIK